MWGASSANGAESSCAAKISASLDAAIVGRRMAREWPDRVFPAGEGLVKDGIEATIQSIGRMAREGMRDTDIEMPADHDFTADPGGPSAWRRPASSPEPPAPFSSLTSHAERLRQKPEPFPYYIRKQPEDSSSPGRLLPLGCTCTGYPVFAAMLHSIKHAKRICCAKNLPRAECSWQQKSSFITLSS